MVKTTLACQHFHCGHTVMLTLSYIQPNMVAWDQDNLLEGYTSKYEIADPSHPHWAFLTRTEAGSLCASLCCLCYLRFVISQDCAVETVTGLE